MRRNTIHQRIAAYVYYHPNETYAEISRKLHIGFSTLTRIAALYGIRRPTGKRLVVNEAVLGEAAKSNPDLSNQS
jgi:hypothetical protein